MADPKGVGRVRQQRVIVLALTAGAVAACTKVRPPVDPLPAAPLPRVAVHQEPTRRPWPVVARPTSLPPDAGPPAIVDTLNGDPKGLKREDINSALQAALPALAGCVPTNGPPSIGLSFDAEPEGHATNIQVSGAGPDVTACVSATLAQVKLPVFEGKPVPVQFPISVYRPPVPAAPAAAATEPAPAAVPIAGATVPSTPPAGTSTAPYVPPSMPASAGSAPATDKVRTFIQP